MKKLLKYLSVTVFLIINNCHSAIAWNYCRNQSFICENTNSRHFSCTGELMPQATFASFLPITWRMRDVFLELHNQFRDALASGTTKNNRTGEIYPQATRLREFIWDRELEYIAHLHTKNCHYGPSKCHCSSRFQNVGENIGFVSSNSHLTHAVINKSLADMFKEKDLISNVKAICDGFQNAKHEPAEHFTTMLQDQAHRMGCALALCFNCSETYCYYMACYYDFTNIEKVPVYKAGKALSECADWESKPSKHYKHLCSNNGNDYPQTN